MDRVTSDNTFEMAMCQLALNQVYIGDDGLAWYRNAPEDELSVCDLIRKAAEAVGVELPVLSDDDQSDLMSDWLQYGAERPEGVLAILYRALWAMAPLRAKLSHYEDTGLEPDDVTALIAAHDTVKDLLALALTQPNAPLTLDELREMDGEPIYITGMGWRICYGIDDSGVMPTIKTGLTTRLSMKGYGKTWLAYRRKPEEGT